MRVYFVVISTTRLVDTHIKFSLMWYYIRNLPMNYTEIFRNKTSVNEARRSNGLIKLLQLACDASE